MKIHSSVSGFKPQLLPIALLHRQRVVINLLHLFSKSSFQVSFLSRMTPRYLACLEISRRCPFSSNVLVVLHFYRQVKMTTSVLPGFTESPVVQHQVSKTFGYRYIPVSEHIAGPVNYGYGDSLYHSSTNHFTGYVVKGTLNIHKCSNSESFEVQLVLNQIHPLLRAVLVERPALSLQPSLCLNRRRSSSYPWPP